MYGRHCYYKHYYYYYKNDTAFLGMSMKPKAEELPATLQRYELWEITKQFWALISVFENL